MIMNEAEARDLLSREELAALLQELKTDDARGAPFAESATARLSPLTRILGDFSEDQSRSLSTLHQRSIGLGLIDLQEVQLRDFVALLLPMDRVLELRLQPGDHRLYMLLGRSMVYSWLALAFGAKETAPMFPVPERPYSRIEERFLRRAGADLADQLQSTWSFKTPVQISVVDLLEAEAVPHDAGKWAMASFDLTGIGDLCRFRLLVPQELYAPASEETDRGPQREVITSALQGAVLEMPVRVHAEAGFADVPLRRVAELKVGDLIRLTPSHPRGLVVRVEDEPKYVAERGSVGGRLAVQLIDGL